MKEIKIQKNLRCFNQTHTAEEPGHDLNPDILTFLTLPTLLHYKTLVQLMDQFDYLKFRSDCPKISELFIHHTSID